MNERARAYLLKQSVLLHSNGVPERVLPLDKVQGFLDLIQPSDVPSDKLQKLYAYQAELLEAIRAHFQQCDHDSDSTDDRADGRGGPP